MDSDPMGQGPRSDPTRSTETVHPQLAPIASALEARPLINAGSVVVLGVLPVFLVGALALQVQRDLSFSASELGIATSAFFASTTAFSAMSGRVCDIVGATRAMRAAALLASGVSLSIAAMARTFWHLVALLAAAGLVHAIGQPATNRYLAHTVPQRRHGIAFGIKQSAVPSATLLAGLAVPGLGHTVGWRWAFVLVGVAGLITAGCLPGDFVRPNRAGDGVPAALPIGPLAVLAFGAGLAAGSSASLGVFAVSSGALLGISDSRAGLIIALSSVLGIAMRLVSGHIADIRARRHLRLVAAMLATGAIGYAALATGHLGLFMVGVPIAYGAGWGWSGLFMLSVVRLCPDAPAAATGVTMTGTSAGSVLCPLIFGFVAEHRSYGLAWGLSGAFVLVGSVAILYGDRMVRGIITA